MKIVLLKLLMFVSRYTLRLFFIQIVCMNLGFAASTSSQSLDKIKVSISLEDATLTTVFSELEAKTSFVFAYSDKLDSNRSFDLHYQNTSLRKVLEDLAKEASIEFKRINNTISVTSKEDRKLQPVKVELIPVSGKVTDDSGEPLPGDRHPDDDTDDLDAVEEHDAHTDRGLAVRFVCGQGRGRAGQR